MARKGKNQREKEQAAKTQAKLAKKQHRRQHKGMTAFTAQYDCGCCYATMYFKDSASAEAAFRKAGLQLSAAIKDDEGTVFESIDTFYGFSADPGWKDVSPLLRLMDKL